MITDQGRSYSHTLSLIIRTSIIILVLLICLAPALPVSAESGPIGMVADNSGKVHIFDAGTNTVIGTVELPLNDGFLVGDCAISPDGTLGFVTDFNYNLWIIDLVQSPPVLASGTNPVPISNPGEDVAVTPDGKYAVVVDGAFGENVPVSLVDIADRQEIDTLVIANNHDSVDALNDGSLLVTSFDSQSLYRIIVIGGSFNLVHTGETMAFDYPINVYGSPKSCSGFVVGHYDLMSFLIPGLSKVDTCELPGGGVCGVIHPAGNRVFVRTCDFEETNSFVIAYSFNSITGHLGIDPLFTIPVTPCTDYYGIEQMAITPDGSRLYVPEGDVLNVYNAETGDQLDSITAKIFEDLTGICFKPEISSGRGPVSALGGELRETGKSSLVVLCMIPLACLITAGLALKLAGRRTVRR
ncbi:MAG: hypothetical protein JXA46_03940 [Dehalococcoidales bacterium]|nr:hypothetical protein [Dehalococcoidales bacterium]